MFVGFSLFLILLTVVLTTPAIQSDIAQFVTKKINERYGINIQINKVAIFVDGTVVLKNVNVWDDRDNTFVRVDRLNTFIIDFKKMMDGSLYFGETSLENVEFNIRTYKNDTTSNLDKFVATFDDGKEGSGKFYMSIKKLQAKNLDFTIVDDNNAQPVSVALNDINGELENFLIKGSKIKGDVTSLAMKTHWGIDVKKMKGAFFMNQTSMNLQGLDLKTKESHIVGDIFMDYEEGGLKDFVHAVVLNVDFKNAKISTNDINKFYGEFTPNQMFYVKGKANGTLNTFAINDLDLRTQNGMEYAGRIAFENLMDKEHILFVHTEFDKLIASRNQAVQLLPNVLGNALPIDLDKLETINAFGNVSYGNEQVIGNLNMQSGLGNAVADFDINKVAQPTQATYIATVRLDGFHLGKLIDNQQFGEANLNLKINGKGFTSESLQTEVEGVVDSFHFNGYTYRDITLNGDLKVPYYKGFVHSNDPNARFDFDGIVDFTKKTPAFNFTADIKHLALNKLGFIKDSIGDFQGIFRLEGTGNSLEDFLGTLYVENAAYETDGKSYSFENFEIISVKNGVEKHFIINSPDIVDGYIKGNFKFDQISKIVENALGSLYTHYSPNPLAPGQFVDFDFTISDKIVEILSPNIYVSNQSYIKGHINTDEGDFKLQLNSPLITVSGNHFKSIDLHVDNKDSLQNAFIKIDTIKLKDYDISDFHLINNTRNDSLFVYTEFKGGNEMKDHFNLNFYHTIEEGNASVLGIQRSEIVFKDYVWYINEENRSDANRILFNKKFDDFHIQPITLSHNGQELTLEGDIKGDDFKDLRLNFKEVELGKVTPDMGESMALNGFINGSASFKQNKDIYHPLSNITIKDFAFNNILLGDFDLNIKGDDRLKKFDVNASIVNDFVERFYVRGDIAIEQNATKLNLDAGLDNFTLAPLTPFLSSVFKDIRGNASGRVTVLGTAKDPKINGRLHLKEAGMRPVFTGVDYAFEENAVLDLTENKFFLNRMKITDTKHNTQGVVNGMISHNMFKNWALDVSLSSSNLLALDSDYVEGTPYYGTAFINGSASIKGAIEALNIKVDVTSNPGTHIKIPLDDAGGLGDNNYVHFLTKEEKERRLKGITTTVVNNRFSGMQLDFEMYVTPDAVIEILLDRHTDHGMKGKGAGFITMAINTLGSFNMWGDFMVYEGEYNFKYENIINKKFEVGRYGTIRWDGDPLGAILDLEAVYKTQANPSVILENSAINRKIDTEVTISLNGSLSNPEINFDIKFPNVNSVIKSEIDYKLADKDTREMQAMALLATGSFLTGHNASTAMYGSLFERAGSLFEDLFSDADSKFKIGMTYSQRDVSQYSENNTGRVGLTLSTNITDRILINGKLGVPVGGAEENAIVGDVEVQLLLNEDGTLKARVFNRENNMYYLGEGVGYTQGAGFTYEVDFDTFKEFMQKIFYDAEKRARKKEAEQQNQNQTHTPDSDDDYGVEFLKYQERNEEEGEQ